MFTPDQLQAFKDKINNAQSIALFGHANIDGDAVGSVLGLGRLLEKLGKEVAYYTTLSPSKYFNFVKGVEKIRTDFNYGEYDLIGFLDFTGYGRIGAITLGHEEYFDAANIFVVDHHIDDPGFLTDHALKLKDIDASSNCELLLELCNQLWPDMIDSEVATNWYMGLLTDTGMFQFQKDTVRTLGNAMVLAQYGADKDNLVKYLFNSAPKGLLDFMKIVTPRIRFEDHICSAWYSLDEAASCGLDNDQAESVMIFVRSIYGVAVYAEFKVEAERIRMSLRSGYTDAGRLNVQLIAKTLNGGGHMYAAGCAVPRNHDIALEDQIQGLAAHINSEAAKQFSQ